MTIKSLPAASTQPRFYEYSLTGGLKVHDGTTGKVNVVALDKFPGMEKYQPPYYQILAGDKRVFSLGEDPIKGALIFVQSLVITLTEEKGFIKVDEADSNGTTVQYVDIDQEIENAHRAYTYFPRELSLEEVKAKVKELFEACQDLDPDILLYNRHGVAVFGYEKSQHVFYWASPGGKLEKMKNVEISLLRDGKTTSARSLDNGVYFSHVLYEESFLNGEPAKKIERTSFGVASA